MISLSTAIAFSLLCLGLVLTPGPNMIYLISRSIAQGRMAAMISLMGVCLGFIVYASATAFGVAALLFALPSAYFFLKTAGAIYLFYLAWLALKPGGQSPFQIRELPQDSAYRLFSMGFITSVLNPKVGMIYISLLPQFIRPENGSVFMQSLMLSGVHIGVSIVGNGTVAMVAGSIAAFLKKYPFWMRIQRWLMGSVLLGLGLHMLFE
jgi:threonine/homoserine/homoserine lactone efflux protein